MRPSDSSTGYALVAVMQLFVEFEHVPALAVVVGVGDVRTVVVFILRVGGYGRSAEHLIFMVAADEDASLVLAGLQLNGGARGLL